MFLESARVRALARASVLRALASVSAITLECIASTSAIYNMYACTACTSAGMGLGEDSAGPARRKSTEARRREHGSLSSECRGVKQKARRLGGPKQNSEISEGERWLVVFTRAGTYQLTVAHAGPWPVSFQHSQATRERAVKHSRVTHAGKRSSTRKQHASERSSTRE